ncbi:MAG: VanZ family protein [Candidatus Kapaibacterium sp.]
MIRFIKYHLPLTLFLVFIFVMSSLPGESISGISFEVSDKILHAGAYFFLYFLFHHSLSNLEKFQFIKENAFLFAFLFTILYAASDEFHQMYNPTRNADVYDLVADAVGGLIAYIVAKLLIFFKGRKTDNVSA